MFREGITAKERNQRTLLFQRTTSADSKKRKLPRIAYGRPKRKKAKTSEAIISPLVLDHHFQGQSIVTASVHGEGTPAWAQQMFWNPPGGNLSKCPNKFLQSLLRRWF